MWVIVLLFGLFFPCVIVDGRWNRAFGRNVRNMVVWRVRGYCRVMLLWWGRCSGRGRWTWFFGIVFVMGPWNMVVGRFRLWVVRVRLGWMLCRRFSRVRMCRGRWVVVLVWLRCISRIWPWLKLRRCRCVLMWVVQVCRTG